MFSVEESLHILQSQLKTFPTVCCVLGTGWNEVVHEAKVIHEIPYDELFGVGSGVPGHVGKLVIAELNGTSVAFMVGRFHIYEGYTAEEVTRPIQVFAKLGLKTVILTAAAGGLNQVIQVGDFVIMNDVITLLCQTPLKGAQFIDMSQACDPELRKIALQIAQQHKFSAREGVYAYAHGPHFETPADKRFLMNAGADMVGMSVVPELIMARALGIKVLGIGFVTNLAFVKHAHEDVLKAAQDSSSRMVTLLKGILETLQ